MNLLTRHAYLLMMDNERSLPLGFASLLTQLRVSVIYKPLLKSTTLLTSPKARGKKALPSCTTCREPRRVNAGNRSGVTPPVDDGALIPDIGAKDMLDSTSKARETIAY